MSGTSLDGLDIAYCSFNKTDENWAFNLIHAESVSYPENLLNLLKKAVSLSGLELSLLDIQLGKFFGMKVKEFISKHKIVVDFVASHGHTVFHQPQNRLTLQIGSGYEMHRILQIPIIYDFRSKDVSLGGQGAPLVPIGDQQLFNEYLACVNLGGISNISYESAGDRIAFDICPVNMVLNYLADKAGQAYDKDGEMASKGEIHHELFEKLIELERQKENSFPSLGYEWVSENVFPLLETTGLSVTDLLATVTSYICESLSSVLNPLGSGKILLTGGGTHNRFLISQLNNKLKDSIRLEIPDPDIINFKEAIIFGFLGVLRIRNEVNCLSSVTRSEKDNSGGIIIT